MSRALLQQALDALDTCDAHLEVSGMNYGCYNQEAVHNTVKALAAALAQPEPSPVAWMEKHGHMISAAVKMGVAGNCSSEDAQHYTFPLYAAPPAPYAVTYRNSADDVALKRSFEAMESGIVADLRSELAEMTDNRDIILAEVGRYIRMAESADADRLDAQRYRWLRQDTPTSAVPRVWRSNKSAEPTKCLDGSKLDDEIDQAMKGGQP
jgi:hypothetical protein